MCWKLLIPQIGVDEHKCFLWLVEGNQVTCSSHCHHGQPLVLHKPSPYLQPRTKFPGIWPNWVSHPSSISIKAIVHGRGWWLRTWWLWNQGCHWDLRGRRSASTQYLDPITGTLPSVSPLQKARWIRGWMCGRMRKQTSVAHGPTCQFSNAGGIFAVMWYKWKGTRGTDL